MAARSSSADVLSKSRQLLAERQLRTESTSSQSTGAAQSASLTENMRQSPMLRASVR